MGKPTGKNSQENSENKVNEEKIALSNIQPNTL